LDDGHAKLRAILEPGSGTSKVWTTYVNMVTELRQLPSVALPPTRSHHNMSHTAPPIVLVGAPNVGKSSLVSQLSTNNPEINHYPFTTRGIMVGDMEWQREGTAVEQLEDTGVPMRCQIMDTPGLLHRPHEERNKIELLTVAALAWLPAYVLVFVLDLTDTATVPHEEQFRLRADMREQFAARGTVRGWVDVVGKSDLRVLPSAREQLNDVLAQEEGGAVCSSTLSVSCLEGDGLPELELWLRTELEDIAPSGEKWWERISPSAEC
jgi:nucleolar GTP-binding protein